MRPKPSNKAAAYAAVLRYLHEEQDKAATGIIYCLSRDDCEDLAEWLTTQGVSADYYHAGACAPRPRGWVEQRRLLLRGCERRTPTICLLLALPRPRLPPPHGAGMPPAHKVLVQNSWQRGSTRIVVATIAYGMGVDAPHVRFVIHFTVAKSMEGYYQVSGAGGRQGRRVRAGLSVRTLSGHHVSSPHLPKHTLAPRPYRARRRRAARGGTARPPTACCCTPPATSRACRA